MKSSQRLKFYTNCIRTFTNSSSLRVMNVVNTLMQVLAILFFRKKSLNMFTQSECFYMILHSMPYERSLRHLILRKKNLSHSSSPPYGGCQKKMFLSQTCATVPYANCSFQQSFVERKAKCTIEQQKCKAPEKRDRLLVFKVDFPMEYKFYLLPQFSKIG